MTLSEQEMDGIVDISDNIVPIINKYLFGTNKKSYLKLEKELLMLIFYDYCIHHNDHPF